MADQQFCLRWNNHQSTLISVFDTLLENGTLVDCTLAAEGQYLKAHKVVLCACSPYLEALLSQHYEKHPIVILKDVKFSELKSMMDYMYRGEVNISQDQLGTFLKAAESLQIKGLSDNGADGDARDVGSTPKAPPPRKPNVPAPSSRSEPARPDSPLTDGSMSPSSRKRRRVRRSSQDEDSHIENNCDLPSQAQSTPVPNIPAATSSITTTPIVKPAIVKPEQTEINRVDTNSLPADVLKKEIEPISEPLLEPKTEYLEDVNNEDSVEDLTLDDDDDMDGMDISNMSNMSNMSRPGPSHGNDISNQGFAAWNLGANQSGTDEVFMAAQEAVNQHRDSQGPKFGCRYCGKEFIAEFRRKLHIQFVCRYGPSKIRGRRFVEYPQPCIFCGKSALTERTLRRHIINDCNTDKKYACDMCSFKSAWLHKVRRHIAKKHIKPKNPKQNKKMLDMALAQTDVHQPSAMNDVGVFDTEEEQQAGVEKDHSVDLEIEDGTLYEEESFFFKDSPEPEPKKITSVDLIDLTEDEMFESHELDNLPLEMEEFQFMDVTENNLEEAIPNNKREKEAAVPAVGFNMDQVLAGLETLTKEELDILAANSKTHK
ncbi:sex determination protein fruitless-like isoform X5 [Macrosteles quadrilineatus]|uniref:sex determination protein fruitless-like isoform X5 n=1 Tax=Macrosteles quadrilineatus TaxID=74068 RepID=UPI0023E19A59|nr:sex determination protein fruitless-like isoform X5 [Macrosteles quadrilineatus]